MANVLEQELFSYFLKLNEKEKKSFVQLLKNFINDRNKNTLVPTLAEYTKELDQADIEIESGDFILHEDVVKYFSKK